MIRLGRICERYNESGALNSLVSIHAAVNEHTFMTKGGDLLVVLGVEGVDYECLDPSEIDQIAGRFVSALRVFDEPFRIYQYLIKRDNTQILARRQDHPVVEEAIASRMAYLKQKADRLYSLEMYAVVAHEGFGSLYRRNLTAGQILRSPLSSLPQLFSTERKLRELEGDLRRACQTLAHKVESFVAQLRDVIRLEILDKERGYQFLRGLLNYAPYKIDDARLKYDQFIDFQACDSLLECHPDHLRLDDYHVEVLTLKDPPAHTFAHMLRGLYSVRSKLIVVTEWKRESNLKMRKLIQSKRRHFHNSKSSMMNYVGAVAQGGPKDMLVDDAAVALVADLGGCLEQLEVKGNYFGQFTLTVILYDKDPAAVKRAVADCYKVFATHGGQLTEERYNLLNAWLAILPGNHAFNLRSLWLLNTNYADLSFLLTQRAGEMRSSHLGDEYLAVLESEGGVPYFLNLHYQDNGHWLILGATGSGKSFLLNFLLTNLQKYRPRTYIFDLGGSYRSLTELFQGSYLHVGIAGGDISMNPFCLEPTKENLHFLHSFVKVLIESTGYRLSAEEDRELYDQIENLYAVEPEQRRLFTLANILSRNLRRALQNWAQGGPYGALFDNVDDNLTFSTFQTFDFEGMDKHAAILEPLLFYILHRANAAIYDENLATTLKVFVVDEAWRFFRHPTIKLYILEALKTWRKRNAAMLLATQSNDDLLRSEMLPVVVESCATKVFLANPGMDPNAYRETFHLNRTEAELIAGLLPKQQILLKRPDLSKVLNLNVDPMSYWLYTNSPYDNQRRREAFERYGFKQGLEILARGNQS